MDYPCVHGVLELTFQTETENSNSMKSFAKKKGHGFRIRGPQLTIFLPNPECSFTVAPYADRVPLRAGIEPHIFDFNHHLHLFFKARFCFVDELFQNSDRSDLFSDLPYCFKPLGASSG